MTQFHNPSCGRAFSLRFIARRQAAKKQNNEQNNALRVFKVAAQNYGLFVREPNGLEMEVQLKWLLGIMEPYFQYFPSWVIAKQLRNLVKYRREGAPIVLTRSQIDYFSLTKEARIEKRRKL